MSAFEATLQLFCNQLKPIIYFAIVSGLTLNNFVYSRQPIDYEYHSGNRSASVLRFRDFEPRAVSKSHRDLKFDRLARGFHFYPTADDLIIEMEFIVPFFKVPIGPGFNLNRSILRNLANLQFGSLFNSGAIVGIGALIATLLKTIATPQILHFNEKKKDARLNNYNNYNYTSPNNGNQTQNSIFHQDTIADHVSDISVCVKEMLCSYLQNKADTDSSRASSSISKIIDGLLQLNISKQYLNGTALYDIWNDSKRRKHCGLAPERCKRLERRDVIFNTLSKLIF